MYVASMYVHNNTCTYVGGYTCTYIHSYIPMYEAMYVHTVLLNANLITARGLQVENAQVNVHTHAD